MQRPVRKSRAPSRRSVNSSRIIEIPVDVVQTARQLREHNRIECAMPFKALARALHELLRLPAGPADADDRHVQLTVRNEALQRRKNLLGGQISSGAKEHESVCQLCCHGV